MKKFICIGGNLNGQEKYAEEVPDTYQQYNRSGYGDNAPKAILIHESVLNVSETTQLHSMPRHSKVKTKRQHHLQVWEEQREV